MTLSLQSRVLALAGVGVFAAGAALSMVSRHSLIAIGAWAEREQGRAAAFAARGVERDLLSDLQALQGAVTAPRVQATDVDRKAREAALMSALQQFRLAESICFTDRTGAPDQCVPLGSDVRFTSAPFMAAAREAIESRRPVISSFVPTEHAETAVAVVPMLDGTGAAAALVNAHGAFISAMFPRHEGVTLTSREPATGAAAGVREVRAAVGGTPWVVKMAEPASDEIAAFRRRSLWLAPSLTLLAVLMAWAIVLSVRRPVQALTAAAERIASGDLSQPIAGGADEIGRLADALEHMRAQLRRSMDAAESANTLLDERVRQRTAQLARVLRRVISAQEDERRRVARELHDETSQVVAAMAMTIDAAGTSWTAATRADLRQFVDRLHDGLHRLITNLRPSVLDDLGLAAGIEWLAEHHLRRAGIATRCELRDLQECRAGGPIETTLFRVVQEAISNIVRHADASAVLIQGGLAGGRIWIEIEDDGRGFDPASIAADPETLRGVGLLGMRERIGLIGGTLTIDSAEGEGARVRIEAPVRLDEPGMSS